MPTSRDTDWEAAFAKGGMFPVGGAKVRLDAPHVAPAARGRTIVRTRELCPSGLVLRGNDVCVWTVGVLTASEANGREWRKRSRRTKSAKAAVIEAFGPKLSALATLAEHYHKGSVLKVTLTRLGQRKLDKVNLGSALKSTEDHIASLCGANDGDARWQAEFEQEPECKTAGVRVRIEVLT